MTEYKNSVVSRAKLEPLFSFGDLYVSDFLKDGEEPKGPPCEIEVAFDPFSTALQLTKQPDSSLMWGSMYFYKSATNPAMRESLRDLAQSTVSCIDKGGGVYLDIAQNDGTLLSYLDKNKYTRIGIDPSDYPEAINNCDIVIKDYFSAAAFRKSGYEKVDFCSCAAMYYDLSEPKQYLQDVYEILADNGIFTLQLSYTPANILQNELGVFCHEHLTYQNLHSIKYLTDQVGFIIKDVELNNVNGGSIRLYLQKSGANNFLTIADRDICKIKVDSLYQWERNNGFCEKEVYLKFFQNIQKLKKQTVEFIKDAKFNGKSVWAYAASTKGNSLLQFFGLDHTLIDGIAEKQEVKWGRRTIGTDIPIYSEERMRQIQPDYLLVLPWFFKSTFIEREKEYLSKGGTMIFPAPEFSLHHE